MGKSCTKVEQNETKNAREFTDAFWYALVISNFSNLFIRYDMCIVRVPVCASLGLKILNSKRTVINRCREV